jgi:CRISPR-associated endonuclease Cas1
MLSQKFTLPYPPLQVCAGVLVADGYGISLRVLYGKLHVEDGIGPHRRSIVLDRAGSGPGSSRLERLVLLGKSGSITLEALAWLRAIGAALVHLAPDGALLAHSVPFGYSGHPIRRAQALAVANGLDVTVARDIIARKMEGQRTNLVRLHAKDLRGLDRLREALNDASTIDDVRLCEAKAAAIYWNAWSKVSIRMRGRDLLRVPSRWTRYDSRASVLTGAPRAATNPVNALLNYCYALLESESRLALLAAGLDPTLGVLHADQRNRDSFALDAMEPARPDVDAFVLDLLEGQVFTSRDFVELSNGVCRVRAPLTHALALTLPQWRMRMAPVVAHLAQAFRAALSNPPTFHTQARSRAPMRSARIAQPPSPLAATLRKPAKPRTYTSKSWSARRPEALALIPAACAACGKPVLKRRRRYCEACLPQARRARGLRAIAAARKALATETAAGKDPRASDEAGRKRGEANAEHHRRNREWKREHGKGAKCGRAWFLREITPKLDAFSLAEIAEATGLSLAACSRFRAGTRVPHPRHWEAFISLTKALRN